MKNTANFSAFEFEEELVGNLREYSLANSLYWALAEGHACEQSARRNAMDVRLHPLLLPSLLSFSSTSSWTNTDHHLRRTPPRTLVR